MAGNLKRIKVVAFGSHGSGKTTLVRLLDSSALSTDIKQHDGSTTVALDFGVREHKGYKLHIYGTPGQERFEVARKAASFGLHIGLVVVDSIRGMTDMEKRLMKELKDKKIPCIVIANKHDLAGASFEGVVKSSDGCMTLPVSAATGAGVEAMLDQIIETAKGRMPI